MGAFVVKRIRKFFTLRLVRISVAVFSLITTSIFDQMAGSSFDVKFEERTKVVNDASFITCMNCIFLGQYFDDMILFVANHSFFHKSPFVPLTFRA